MIVRKTIVIGGSGFIGTNVVEWLLTAGHEVLNIDIKDPQNEEHKNVFKKVDILNQRSLTEIFTDFAPTKVVHLGARTDLHEKKDLKRYSANIQGVENMVQAISQQPSVEKAVFTSTKLVCPTDYTPKSYDDYCPTTLYGKSKMVGEKIVKNCTTMQCDWCIVRPTSIWGPWSMGAHLPYGRFFQMIARGRYVHPGRANPPKSFGYVGNTVFQIEKLLDAPRQQIHQKVFYLSDYDVFTIRDWADMIALKLGKKKVRTMPEPVVVFLAWGGDLIKLCGIQEPPFSSFRLRNMRADTTGVPLDATERVTGPLPYSMEQGVEETIAWFRKHDLI